MELQVIARAHNGFHDKFGIPRQPSTDSAIETRIVFEPEFRVREALRGIEDYSHLWLIWGFDKAVRSGDTQSENSWSPTVRPPRLGGNQRMGVFATRSPFRPNGLGLSCVCLSRTEPTPNEGLHLVVTGADMLDGTPIYDIKPYLSYSDSHPDARNGFGEATKNYRLQVEIAAPLLHEAVLADCPWQAIEELLCQDPRPAYQHDPERIYRLDFADWNVAFQVSGQSVHVLKLTKTNR